MGFRPSQSGRIGEEGKEGGAFLLGGLGCWTGLSTVAKAMVGRELVIRESGTEPKCGCSWGKRDVIEGVVEALDLGLLCYSRSSTSRAARRNDAFRCAGWW